MKTVVSFQWCVLMRAPKTVTMHLSSTVKIWVSFILIDSQFNKIKVFSLQCLCLLRILWVYFFAIFHLVLAYFKRHLSIAQVYWGPMAEAKCCLKRWVWNIALQSDPEIRTVFSLRNIANTHHLTCKGIWFK